ncbi:MAG: DNA polymerase III subunit gamma/tau [Kiritimatiellia bacterium]
MAYEVLARKWRPQTFEEVVGQEHVTQTLKNAIKMDRIAHAYLFVGPRGIGKTSIARIFSKALNCEKGPTPTPCNKCDPCREITMGVNLDVLEIDGASNNGVEQIRALRETVSYMPTRSRYKIYIIDEVHMLTAAAFNALLKTLEEPPPHVKFIFATTEPDKVLPTILSRCQRFDLRRIPLTLIVERLRQIAGREGVAIEDDALLAIARGAEGALRDAESALDQLISFRGEKIAEEDVLSVFGLTARSTLEELAGQVVRGDMQAVIRTIAALDAEGKDLQRLLIDLMEHFRNLLVFLAGGTSSEALDVAEQQLATLQSQAKATDIERTLRFLDILAEAEGRMRYTLSRRTVLETALIRSCRAAEVVTLEEILAELKELRKKTSEMDGTTSTSGVDEVEIAQYDTAAGPSAVSTPAPPARVLQEPQTANSDHSHSTERDLLIAQWRVIAERAGKLAIAARTALRRAAPLAVSSAQVVIGIAPENAADQETLESDRCRKALERILSETLRRSVTVAFSAKQSTSSASSGAQQPRPKQEFSSPPAQSETRQAAGKRKRGRSKAEIIEDPVVKRVLKTFGGTVVKMEQ